ncbi:uncharacterized protein DSM5745_09897 [Aspergillus mulundensis]|uniref:Uncharacterized protein n=1 Tax=Aspergillus mulundensis TaxID=1810919 RepID=A0A3D8QRN6_9EURO|nr:hypothetical protein DSM5745_09897 [Aspergillus mulundensis]RDW64486.1 hypothetical protein DSM5745_09897 [Aspergillus mulundensis]
MAYNITTVDKNTRVFEWLGSIEPICFDCDPRPIHTSRPNTPLATSPTYDELYHASSCVYEWVEPTSSKKGGSKAEEDDTDCEKNLTGTRTPGAHTTRTGNRGGTPNGKEGNSIRPHTSLAESGDHQKSRIDLQRGPRSAELHIAPADILYSPAESVYPQSSSIDLNTGPLSPKPYITSADILYSHALNDTSYSQRPNVYFRQKKWELFPELAPCPTTKRYICAEATCPPRRPNGPGKDDTRSQSQPSKQPRLGWTRNALACISGIIKGVDGGGDKH